jgi:FKBP-type peptidyl-prolyl cis-trans isomerase
MIRQLIPGAVALGLIATATAQAPAADTPPAAAQATTPPIEVPAKPAPDPAAVKADSSYALGFRTGGGFAQQFGRFGVTPDDLDMEPFLAGFLAAVRSQQPELEEARLQAAMEALGEMLQEREKTAAAANLDAGKKFLEENAKREGVTVTASGLQYEILEKGGDEKYTAPKEGEAEKEFLVNYRGTLIDGTEFDASPPGEPVPMTLQVVEGFKEALTMMPIGSKWKLFIPSEMAYGEERRSAQIAPNSVLIFELELVKIQDAPAAPQGMPFPMPGGPGGE